MNYRRIYDNLIAKHGSWEKPKGVYAERHRKIPGCAGGKYVKGNAFYMSARAHFLAHLLLARIYGGRNWSAVKLMSRGDKSSKLYERSKIEHNLYNSELARLQWANAESRSKILEAQKNSINQEYRDKMSKITSSNWTEKRRKEASIRQTLANSSMSEETKRKISISKTGKKRPELSGDNNPTRKRMLIKMEKLNAIS